jgi:hypothetical protein
MTPPSIIAASSARRGINISMPALSNIIMYYFSVSIRPAPIAPQQVIVTFSEFGK